MSGALALLEASGVFRVPIVSGIGAQGVSGVLKVSPVLGASGVLM